MDSKSLKVTLRPLTATDAAELDAASDEKLFSFSRAPLFEVPSGGFPFLWDSPQRVIERISFAILADGELVGEVSLSAIDLDRQSAAITLGIAKAKHRNQRIGSQALEQILTYAFYSLGLSKVTAETLATNLPAVRSLKKGGFRLVGVEPYAVQMANLRLDRHHYALTVDEFSRRQV